MKKLSNWLVMGIVLLLLGACGSSSSGDPALEQAARVFQRMAKPAELSRSVYAAAFPDGKPSQYVSYLFSGMGKAEWPVAMDEYEADAMRSAGIATIPDGVAIVARRPDPDKDKQLVIRYDDGRGVIIAEGYTDPKKAAVLQKEWTLPQVQPSPGVQAMYESNRDMGMSFQSF